MEAELLRNLAVTVGAVGAVYYLWRKAKGALDKVHAMRDELLAAGTDPAPLPEGEDWAWARGVVGLVIQRDVDEAMSPAAARMVLAQAWKVSSLEEAGARVKAIAKEHPELETLRAVRQIAIAWLGVRSHTFGEVDGRALVVEATRTLRGLHGSWAELGAAYVRELGEYAKSLRDADKQIATTKVRVSDLEVGLWRELAFRPGAEAEASS